MKDKELIGILVGIVLILSFAVWLFIHQKDMDRNNLLREDIKNDSLIIQYQMELFDRDGVINKKLKNHEYRIKKLENK